jgi:EAL domain-containing protein (putative c-di-GMP-specific phosphodiesterase class I)
VAEGIETKQQLAFLQSKHCTEGQGYYYSRPVAAEDFTALMVTMC